MKAFADELTRDEHRSLEGVVGEIEATERDRDKTFRAAATLSGTVGNAVLISANRGRAESSSIVTSVPTPDAPQSHVDPRVASYATEPGSSPTSS